MNPFIPGGSYQSGCSAITITIVTDLYRNGRTDPVKGVTISYTVEQSNSYRDISVDDGQVKTYSGPIDPLNPPMQPNAPFVPAGSYQLSAASAMTITISATLGDGSTAELTYSSDIARYFQDIVLADGALRHVFWPAPNYIPPGKYLDSYSVPAISITADCLKWSGSQTDTRSFHPIKFNSETLDDADPSARFMHDIQNQDGTLAFVAVTDPDASPAPPVNLYGPYVPTGGYQCSCLDISVCVTARLAGTESIFQVKYTAREAPLIDDIVVGSLGPQLIMKDLTKVASGWAQLGADSFDQVYPCGNLLYAVKGSRVALCDVFAGTWRTVTQDVGPNAEFIPSHVMLCKLDEGALSTLDPVNDQWRVIPNCPGKQTQSAVAVWDRLYALQTDEGGGDGALFLYDTDAGQWQSLCAQDDARWSFAANANRLFALSKDGKHVQVTTNLTSPLAWVSLPDCPYSSAVFESLLVSSGSLYAIQKVTRVIWVYSPAFRRWMPIGGDAKACATHPLSSSLYKLSGDGLVMRYVGGADPSSAASSPTPEDPWSVVGGGQGTTSIQAGLGVVYQLNAAGNVLALPPPAVEVEKRDNTRDASFVWYALIGTDSGFTTGFSGNVKIWVPDGDKDERFADGNTGNVSIGISASQNTYLNRRLTYSRDSLPDPSLYLQADQGWFGDLLDTWDVGTVDLWCPSSGKAYDFRVDGTVSSHPRKTALYRGWSKPLEGAEYKVRLDPDRFKFATDIDNFWSTVHRERASAPPTPRSVSFFDSSDQTFFKKRYVLRVRGRSGMAWAVTLKSRERHWITSTKVTLSDDEKFEADVPFSGDTTFSSSWTLKVPGSFASAADVVKTLKVSGFPSFLQNAASEVIQSPKAVRNQKMDGAIEELDAQESCRVDLLTGESLSLPITLSLWYPSGGAAPNVAPLVAEASFKVNATTPRQDSNWFRAIERYAVWFNARILSSGYTPLEGTKTDWIYQRSIHDEL